MAEYSPTALIGTCSHTQVYTFIFLLYFLLSCFDFFLSVIFALLFTLISCLSFSVPPNSIFLLFPPTFFFLTDSSLSFSSLLFLILSTLLFHFFTQKIRSYIYFLSSYFFHPVFPQFYFIFLFTGFMASLSINLAVLNSLPFPSLDGGQLAFVIAETIAGMYIPSFLVSLFSRLPIFLLPLSLSSILICFFPSLLHPTLLPC